uniref:ATPbinding Cassette (ABC) superfamily putative n=1 Tax=Albugo laibachii Nc14 TaxID=890382 RepID=F0WE99_9STRA|nr:ATPbinding Cassette (ABC) superfamily putative [Albugo laibachii Nc14]|eukprot:CCA19530.1 ATPbinding Cassette (ABC) superfamily putative [Albugo laibachii Nc14]
MSLIISCAMKTQAFHRLVVILRKHQFAGAIIYACTFAFLIVICFPSTMLELLAGYIFDVKLGLPLAILGKMSGCLLSFCIGRYFCRQRVRRYMENGHPFYLSLETLLQQRQCLIVFLTRIAFFPIAIKNYGLSVLGVSWITFSVAALLTGVPYSILWVYSGHMAQHLTSLFGPSANKSDFRSSEWKWHLALAIVGFASSIVLIALVGISTRRYIEKLAQQLQDEAKSEGSDGKTESL